MPERRAETAHVVEGQFGQSIQVRQSEWYGQRLVELLPTDGAPAHGGQVLMTPSQAVDLIAVLSQVIGDARASGYANPPASTTDGERP